MFYKFEIKNFSSRYINDVLASVTFGINTNSFDEEENAFWKNGGILLYFCHVENNDQITTCKYLTDIYHVLLFIICMRESIVLYSSIQK